MSQDVLARSLAAALLLLTALAGAARAEEPRSDECSLLLLDGHPPSISTRNWELAFDAPSASERDVPGLRLGGLTPSSGQLRGQGTPSPPSQDLRPSQGDEPKAIFATLSDHRLATREFASGREARLLAPARPALDWSGYGAREQRGGDPLESVMRTLDWPDLEGGSEPIVPTVSRTPDGKRSGLGVGWRF